MNLIVAVDKNWGIGKDGDLLFHVSEDMKHFKSKTTGKVVVMGRTTLNSLPGQKPLPNRVNIVLSSTQTQSPHEIIFCDSINKVFEKIKEYPTDDVFIIGGSTLYKQFLDYCEYAYVTKFEKDGNADTSIENLDKMSAWNVIERSETKVSDGLEFTFNVYKNSFVKEIDIL